MTDKSGYLYEVHEGISRHEQITGERLSDNVKKCIAEIMLLSHWKFENHEVTEAVLVMAEVAKTNKGNENKCQT